MALIEARVGLAGLVLLAVVAMLRQRPAWCDRRRYLVLGALSAAAPFALIAAAELHITASLASILNAATPLFSLLLSVAWLGEPLTSRRLVGVLLGVLGVGVLVGLGPVQVDSALVMAVAASLLAVTFLVPVFGSAWGALFLDEEVTPCTGLGLLIVLGGVALLTGVAAHRKP